MSDVKVKGYGFIGEWKQKAYEPVFGEYTASFLLERMLSRIPDKFDKREGSIIYDALAPAAIELEIMYMELDYILKNVFGDTADREGLIRLAYDRGMSPYPASQAIVKGEFNVEVDIGKTFNFDDLNFTVKKFIENQNEKYYYELVCNKYGAIGNVPYGKLIPVDHIKDLKSAFIVGVIKPGEEEEDTEEFRNRYYRNIMSNAYGGNIDDYLDKVHAIDGVGGVKVYPIWQGGGTVLIVFSDANYMVPKQELIDKVQTIIDPVTNHGKGIGIAPIGHTVTVRGVKEDKINFNFELLYKDGFNWDKVVDEVKATLELYLKDLRREWQNYEKSILRLRRIETRLLDIEGVLDINSSKINGFARNYEVDGENIPVLGDVNGK